MARPIPEVKMVEPGERVQFNLDEWSPWKRERFFKNTLDAFNRWKKEKAEAEAATAVKGAAVT